MAARRLRSMSTSLLDFFADRLKVQLREEGVRHDLIAAVFALGGRGRSRAAAGAGRCARRLPRHRGRRQPADRLSARRATSCASRRRRTATPMTSAPIQRCCSRPRRTRLHRALDDSARSRPSLPSRARISRRHGGAGRCAGRSMNSSTRSPSTPDDPSCASQPAAAASRIRGGRSNQVADFSQDRGMNHP